MVWQGRSPQLEIGPIRLDIREALDGFSSTPKSLPVPRIKDKGSEGVDQLG